MGGEWADEWVDGWIGGQSLRSLGQWSTTTQVGQAGQGVAVAAGGEVAGGQASVPGQLGGAGGEVAGGQASVPGQLGGGGQAVGQAGDPGTDFYHIGTGEFGEAVAANGYVGQVPGQFAPGEVGPVGQFSGQFLLPGEEEAVGQFSGHFVPLPGEEDGDLDLDRPLRWVEVGPPSQGEGYSEEEEEAADGGQGEGQGAAGAGGQAEAVAGGQAEAADGGQARSLVELAGAGEAGQPFAGGFPGGRFGPFYGPDRWEEAAAAVTAAMEASGAAAAAAVDPPASSTGASWEYVVPGSGGQDQGQLGQWDQSSLGTAEAEVLSALPPSASSLSTAAGGGDLFLPPTAELWPQPAELIPPQPTRPVPRPDQATAPAGPGPGGPVPGPVPVFPAPYRDTRLGSHPGQLTQVTHHLTSDGQSAGTVQVPAGPVPVVVGYPVGQSGGQSAAASSSSGPVPVGQAGSVGQGQGLWSNYRPITTANAIGVDAQGDVVLGPVEVLAEMGIEPQSPPLAQDATFQDLEAALGDSRRRVRNPSPSRGRGGQGDPGKGQVGQAQAPDPNNPWLRFTPKGRGRGQDKGQDNGKGKGQDKGQGKGQDGGQDKGQGKGQDGGQDKGQGKGQDKGKAQGQDNGKGVDKGTNQQRVQARTRAIFSNFHPASQPARQQQG